VREQRFDGGAVCLRGAASEILNGKLAHLFSVVPWN
jgi:hypothetical protein